MWTRNAFTSLFLFDIQSNSISFSLHFNGDKLIIKIYDASNFSSVNKRSIESSDGAISLFVIAAMAKSVKLFQSVRKSYETMGIYSSKSNRFSTFNWKIFLIALFIILMLISVVSFFIFKAKSIQDIGISCHLCLSEITTLNNFLLTVWHVPKIFNLIKHCEKFIENSK